MADRLLDLVDAWADSDRPAILDGDLVVTHAELHRRADAVAAALGDRRGTVIGILMERSAEFVVAVLATLKAGAAYLPLDPEYPPARLDQLVRAAACPLTLTTVPHTHLVAGSVAIETLAGAERPQVSTSDEDLAYVMFTSGSTGVPKGVRVPRRAVAGLVDGPDVERPGPDDVVLWVSSPSFDATTFDLWCTLGTGAALVPVPAKASVLDIGDLIVRHGVTTVLFPTGLFHLMVDECVDQLAGLRTVLAGGDVLSAAHSARFLAAVPSCRLVNIYGPTETTVYVARHVVPADVSGTVPIGCPAAGAHLRVLDENLQEASEGQLHIGGNGLALGYLDDPDLTAAKFVTIDGSRFYASGDRVRRRADGALDFVGRLDDQVKKRGFRVEPGEVETALRADPAVRDAAVVLAGDRADTRGLVACVVLRPGATIAEVRSRLALPAYLVPDVWHSVDGLPLTPNGKLDRAGLLRSLATEARPADQGSGGGSVEDVVAAIWREVLNLPEVGPTDDFFELGGHSLLANRVLALIHRRLGPKVSLTALFDHPTVAGLAGVVRGSIS
ncbi:non-ribosomal peptide synthetase [Actinokineospora sp. HUAS TT18]|uniref:non-ribosomal peptide synthetase n=1 Tax=Actinokineospora sp. HUAS TT18 TaxID=3447451 RepID=UPI003F51D7F4